MGLFAARLIKRLVQRDTRDKSERVAPAGRPNAAPVLSSATVAAGHRSARVLSLLLTLEALRAAPDLIDGPASR